MLGVLTGEVKGLQMLDRWRMFNMVYHIVDLKQRPDLIKLLLSNFDYTLNGHPRVLLSKALTAGTKDIRIHATNILRKYAVRPHTQVPGVGDAKWAIQLLVTQLYDPDVEVGATSVKILEKACNNKGSLEFIVECRPALDHLGELGAPLLLRFLSTSIGYHYLDGLDYISNEMDDWFLGRNDSYVSLIEASLARAFVENPEDHPSRMSVFEDETDADSEVHIPPHFYRELTRTREGCKLLHDKGHFDEFASTIRDYGMQSDDAEMLTKVKGCLWAVGNVGSMELGAPFLESCDVVQHIVKIAQEHDILSLRGTAFFVLGLISRSIHGLEILSEFGWDSNTNPLGTSLGFCIPSDLTKFFSIKPWRHETVASIELPASQKTESVEPPRMPSRPRSDSLLDALQEQNVPIAPKVELDPDPTNQRILELVIDLGNMIIFKRAAGELIQLKQQKKAPGFGQPHMFRRVMALLECHHYRLPIRRMILELFEKSVLRHVIFGEDEDDDDDEEPEHEDAGARLPGRPQSGSTGTAQSRSPKKSRLGGRERARSEGETQGSAGINLLTAGANLHGGVDEDDGSDDEENSEEGSSGDEDRTERQRSISDPADLQKDARKRSS